MMVAGWYAVRGRIRGDLLEEVLADEVDGSAPTSPHDAVHSPHDAVHSPHDGASPAGA
jgi:amino acid permease